MQQLLLENKQIQKIRIPYNWK